MEGIQEAVDATINDSVKNFVFDLHDATRRSHIQTDIDQLYRETFPELTDKYYSDKSPWPSAEAIASECDPSDELFLSLYREMTFRHLMSRGRPQLQDHLSAWTNYCRLFDIIIAAEDRELCLNSHWAFEIIAEFVYQFQGFCQFRTDLSRRDEEEIEVLQANPEVWAAPTVISYLRRLISSSNVKEVLRLQKAAGQTSTTINFAEAPTPSKAHFSLGYFAVFGLSRLECLLGDYHGCLQTLEAIDIHSENEIYNTVFSCYLNLYYHLGLSFLMMRRYKDAIRTFSHIVADIYRLTKSGRLSHIVGGDQAPKTNDRICALLVLAVNLTPGCPVDEVVAATMKDKYNEKIQKLEQDFNREIFEALFEKACPKFIVPSIPDYSAHVNYSQDAVRRQVDLFLKQAEQSSNLGKIRSYLKLYTVISVSKLARFRSINDDDFRSELLAIKHMMTQMKSEAGMSPLAGSMQSALDVHFYVADNMIHIDEDQRSQRHEAVFMNQIQKCQEMSDRLKL